MVSKILYRPFDLRYTYYDYNLQRRASYNTTKHLVNDNLALITCRQQSSFDFQHILVSNCITERCTVSLQTKETGYVFPLYLYPKTSQQQTTNNKPERTPNFNIEIISEIEKSLGLSFVPEREIGNVCMANNEEVRPEFRTEFAPIDVLDYIYAVLHSPAYREKYKEFLKIDFPRVPYPTSAEKFWDLVALGGELRELHLLESPEVENFITQYPETGNNIVTRKMSKNSPGYTSTALSAGSQNVNPSPSASLRTGSRERGKVWINDSQYFNNIPLVAWEFYIGGYQPAQKWLKDRQGRELSFEDILHYQKMIVALTETHKIMEKIDETGVETEEIIET